MDHQQLLQLLDKYLRNECTEEEKQAVETWYGRFESRHAAGMPNTAPALEAVYRNMVEQLQQEGEWVETPVRRIRTRWWTAAAAVLVLAIGTGAWLLFRQPAMEMVQTAAGERTTITLPDGTRVWLNVSSRLEYARDMHNGQRTVQLRGEGYFEVAPQTEHPFVIRTADLSVQVLGTAFNLRAYPEDASLETTLVEGKVAVNLLRDPGKRQLLSPGEKLLLTRKKGVVPAGQQDWGEFAAEVLEAKPVNDSPVGESMWRNDRLQFKNKSFGELAKIMERWFNKRIVIQDTALNDNRFSGEFRKEDIQRALKALQLTADFTYDIKGDTVFIQH
ncbi:DUF4974 domain-containing protein [Chitinophaga lutea]|uniref:DUF4974 domain-containing protein n=1 Tax=Chitinophaga lutea TaxID=2488634 RepID=A0A3N4PYU1_9BACT|nr:FecR domain-containing protein [Chitinophaga lutea]RPE08850.1 DUF4974 domain-containing protein [Chitinophaga lutea]